jgi:hypothetical protein
VPKWIHTHKWTPTKEFIDDALGQRDIVALTNLIRDQDLPPEVQQHLADTIHGLLTKKIKWPRRRPPKKGLYRQKQEIAERVWRTMKSNGWKKIGSAIEHIASEEKCSPRTVWECWKVFDPDAYEYRREKAEFDFMMDVANEARAEAALEWLKENEGDREFAEIRIRGRKYRDQGELDAFDATRERDADFHA